MNHKKRCLMNWCTLHFCNLQQMTIRVHNFYANTAIKCTMNNQIIKIQWFLHKYRHSLQYRCYLSGIHSRWPSLLIIDKSSYTQPHISVIDYVHMLAPRHLNKSATAQSGQFLGMCHRYDTVIAAVQYQNTNIRQSDDIHSVVECKVSLNVLSKEKENELVVGKKVF